MKASQFESPSPGGVGGGTEFEGVWIWAGKNMRQTVKIFYICIHREVERELLNSTW